jgi:EAL domain-containing protein (putative c-di-GMP-specific phosphodiesterase class I)
VAPLDSSDPSTLLRNADLAMYRSKARGRDGYEFFESGMNQEASRRLSMEAELRRGLEANHLKPFFQPIVRLIDRLRDKLGTYVAIDDFGTGYSSLGYLKQLPIDTLKVDRSFVKDIPRDEDDKEITSAIIAMAQALRKSVIAEGIETNAQLEFLKNRGCEFGQGYLLGRPAEPSQFATAPLVVDA